MGVPTIFLGYIEEAWPGVAAGGDAAFMAHLQATAASINAHNEAVLTALPSEDPFPPLCRPMFAWPPADAPGIAYNNRIVHFAACVKNADFVARAWLDKFEQLLRRMYWESAYVRLQTVYTGTHEFTWEVGAAWKTDLCKGKVGPIGEWAFTSTLDAAELERMRDG
jgi:hypothetical protein